MTTTPITPDQLKTLIKKLESRGIHASLVTSNDEALLKIKSIIPDHASVMTASSVTLKQIGLIDLLKSGKHPWKNLKDAIMAEQDPDKRAQLRRESSLADYYLGSANAIAMTGEMVVASNTGSQLPGYTFSSPNVVLVCGIQKIVPTLDDAIKRVRSYVLPLEKKRMKQETGDDSTVGKLLIFEREVNSWRKVHVILVQTPLGY